MKKGVLTILRKYLHNLVAHFEFNEAGIKVLRYPAGYAPKICFM